MTSIKINHAQDCTIEDRLSQLFNAPISKAKKELDKISYSWDNIIEIVSQDILNDRMINHDLFSNKFPKSAFSGSHLNDHETCVRVMARETRFSRRILGQTFNDFLFSSHSVKARMTQSPLGIIYVFLKLPKEVERMDRIAELSLRCFVERSKFLGSSTVVGIATERYDAIGFSIDCMYLHIPSMSKEQMEQAEALSKEMNYFYTPVLTKKREDEYPNI